ncbi:MAG: hypothetical protein R3C28_06985 [Pirellulaceae bacterium]
MTLQGIDFSWPSSVARHSAAIAPGGQYPMVVFSPGSWIQGNAYSDFGETMASYGFIVVAISHTGDLPQNWTPDPETQSARDRPRDVQFTIDQMLLKNQTVGDPFYGRIDEQAIGAAGHSFGGYSIMAAQAGYGRYELAADPRISRLCLFHQERIPTLLGRVAQASRCC